MRAHETIDILAGHLREVTEERDRAEGENRRLKREMEGAEQRGRMESAKEIADLARRGEEDLVDLRDRLAREAERRARAQSDLSSYRKGVSEALAVLREGLAKGGAVVMCREAIAALEGTQAGWAEEPPGRGPVEAWKDTCAALREKLSKALEERDEAQKAHGSALAAESKLRGRLEQALDVLRPLGPPLAARVNDAIRILGAGPEGESCERLLTAARERAREADAALRSAERMAEAADTLQRARSDFRPDHPDLGALLDSIDLTLGLLTGAEEPGGAEGENRERGLEVKLTSALSQRDVAERERDGAEKAEREAKAAALRSAERMAAAAETLQALDLVAAGGKVAGAVGNALGLLTGAADPRPCSEAERREDAATASQRNDQRMREMTHGTPYAFPKVVVGGEEA